MGKSRPHVGQRVFVTGASSGIGRAVVMRLSQQGADCVFAAVRSQHAMLDLQRTGGAAVLPVMLDVTDEVMIGKAVAFAESVVEDRGLTGLVNCAGISASGPMECVDMEVLRRVIDVNVLGVVRVTQAFLPLLRLGHGRVVNMSSGAGRAASPLVGPYCASKFALEAISDALRMELHRSGVHVSVVEPGVVDTPMLDKGNAGIDDVREHLPSDAPSYYLGAMTALRKQFDDAGRISPDAVAKVVSRALSVRYPKSRYVIGGDAKLLLILERVLPRTALDIVYRRMFNL